mmetsp:Transcript_39850/g.54278  ORF Transcript_39850/g.54278 Transcript_39850/m.54278 type:complete len:200 (-) Transcript_39850:1968-2567(-)
MQPKSVQETFKDVHSEEDSASHSCEYGVPNEDCDWVSGIHGCQHSLLPKDSSKLCVRKRESPETQVRRCVAHHAKDKFDGLDRLMDNNFSEVVFFVAACLVVFVFVDELLLRERSRSTLVGMCITEEERLRDKDDWNTSHCNEKKRHLDPCLPLVQRLVDGARLKCHVHQRGNQIWGLTAIARAAVVKRAKICSCISSI